MIRVLMTGIMKRTKAYREKSLSHYYKDTTIKDTDIYSNGGGEDEMIKKTMKKTCRR